MLRNVTIETKAYGYRYFYLAMEGVKDVPIKCCAMMKGETCRPECVACSIDVEGIARCLKCSIDIGEIVADNTRRVI